MSKTIYAAAMAALFSANLAQAQTELRDYELSANAGAVSDYRYRGLSQTRLQPAVQAGMDVVHTPTGLYAGTWMSSIQWVRDAGGNAPIEWDVYGGKKGEIGLGVTYDIGMLQYLYPNHASAASPNTREFYGQLTYGPAYVKYAQSTTNLFGFANSKKSRYWDLGFNHDVGTGLTLNAHVGYQSIQGQDNAPYSYADWKIGFTKDLGFASGSIAYVDTNTRSYTGPAPEAKDLGRAGIVIGLSKTF